MSKTKFITDMIKDWRTSAKQCRSVDREAEADIYDECAKMMEERMAEDGGRRTECQSKVVVLCGSSKFCDIMAVCAWLLERDEKAITMGLHLLPYWYATKEAIPDHLAEHEGVADEMDALHLRKIDLADEIFVVNFQDYIGDSTRKEIEYAMSKGIKVRWFRQDEIGQKAINIMP